MRMVDFKNRMKICGSVVSMPLCYLPFSFIVIFFFIVESPDSSTKVQKHPTGKRNSDKDKKKGGKWQS